MDEEKYYQKYLKYKQKYLDLQKLKGGDGTQVSDADICNTTFAKLIEEKKILPLTINSAGINYTIYKFNEEYSNIKCIEQINSFLNCYTIFTIYGSRNDTSKKSFYKHEIVNKNKSIATPDRPELIKKTKKYCGIIAQIKGENNNWISSNVLSSDEKGKKNIYDGTFRYINTKISRCDLNSFIDSDTNSHDWDIDDLFVLMFIIEYRIKKYLMERGKTYVMGDYKSLVTLLCPNDIFNIFSESSKYDYIISWQSIYNDMLMLWPK